MNLRRILSAFAPMLLVSCSQVTAVVPAATQPSASDDAIPWSPTPEPALTATARSLSESMTRVVLTVAARPPSATPTPTDTPTPLPTVAAQLFHTWVRFLAQELGIAIDYPAYFAVPPYSDYFCDPGEARDPLNESDTLWMGDGFFVFTWPPDETSGTLPQQLRATLEEMTALGHSIERVSSEQVDEVPAVRIDYTDFFGRRGILALFTRLGVSYTASAKVGGECARLAADQSPEGALNEFDILMRMFDTLEFVP